MEIYNHVCSCGQSYSDNDPDLYFCPNCVEERKRIAKEVDAKIANRPKKNSMSNLQIAETKGKTINSSNPHGGRATFVRASDLGIRF